MMNANLNLAKPVNVEGIGLNYIVDYYNAFLSSKSENTRINYKSDLTTYFKIIFDKKPEHVTIEDIEQTKSIHATRFYTYLNTIGNNGKPYKGGSIKRKINSIRSFYKFLRVDFESVNAFIFDNIDVKDLSLEKYGNVTWEEVDEMYKYALLHRLEGYQMAMLIKLASVTSIRLSALLELEWEKHFFVKNERGIDVNYIQIVDKSKVNKKPISDKLFNTLQENLGTEGKLFYSLNQHKVGDFIKEICEALKFDPKRNIKFHSLKKAGVNQTLIINKGDITLAQQQGNHSSPATTINHYVDISEDLTSFSSYTLDSELNIESKIEDCSKEELIDAISTLSGSAKFEILRALGKM